MSHLEDRIRLVETGLRRACCLRGRPAPTMRLFERMRFYRTPGVSIAVIDGLDLAWARGYGTLEAGSPSPLRPIRCSRRRPSASR